MSVGSYGRIDNPTIDWSGQATVSINGQAITKTIGSNLGGSVDFSDYNGWVANAKWTGSLVTGQGYPSPANYIATFQPNNNFWSISTFNYYDSYTQSLATEKAALGSVQKSPAGGACYESTCSNIQTIINRHNAVVDTLVSRNDQIGYDAATVVSEKTSGTASSGNVVITLADHRIGIPQITWLVKAAKLGVLIPVGKPEITNIVVNPFASGDSNGVAVVTFRNIGSATGTFSATFTDPTGTFYPTSNTQTARTTVEAGGSGMISVQIGHGSASSAISKTATMTVADVNKPSNMATRDFTISMTVPKACTPGEQRADGLIVSQCRTDGMSWQVILDCNGKTLDYLSGKYSCKDLDKSGLPTVTQTPPTAPCTQNCEEVIDLTPVLWGAILVIFGFMAFTKGWYKNGMFWVGIVILYIIIQTYLIIQGVGSAIEGVLSWRPW
ncbi:MAG: hypothetical protein FIB07_13890 [Candidatus Methanoperedens sp.]|nr:hypothetical protein [Candidatus Methanoperedens sp.]